ncbi:MAG: dipicolinate synthase subunit B [Ruminococcaceae bacterium]|nr:dipicolinate synthase subunit B [Oscillospiraceae bacterium]
MICYAMCGSFCTLSNSFDILEAMSHGGYDFLPVMSEKTYSTDTRFGKASSHIARFEEICKKTVIHTVQDAEPIGPKLHPEAMIICPCTGNTLAKLANGITDSAVTMAAKAHLRNGKPLIIALATNDALSANLVNIGKLVSRKNIFFVPLVQDDIHKKPTSLIAKFDLLPETLDHAMLGKQLMPLFLGESKP